MKFLQNQKIVGAILFAACLFVYSQGISIHGVEYRDDEIFYYQATQEMVRSGNYLSPTYFGSDRFQKPILFYWFVLLSFKVFGSQWFAARLVAVVFAGLTVCFTYRIASLFVSQRSALTAAIMLASAPLFLRHAKIVVPDMALNFFIVASIFYALDFVYQGSRRSSRILFFLMSALGFLVKGFAALVIPVGVLLAFLLICGKRDRLRQFHFFKGFLIWLIIVAPWFLYMSAVHGGGYMRYMIVEETAERILGKDQGDLLLLQAKRAVTHLAFYLRTILSYFLPWSLVFVFVLGPLMRRDNTSSQEREGLILCLIWIVLVLLIFSNMYFTISHYMLVLSTPLSIFVAMGLHKILEQKRAGYSFWLNAFFALALGLGVFAFAFLSVFLAGASRLWLIFFAASYLSLMLIMMERKDVCYSAGILSLFIIGVFSQSALMVKAGVASHGTLQKFAQTIEAGSGENAIIGVGSHDIHEKELQVYFDKELIKAGHSHAGVVRKNLLSLFDHKEEVYCLLTQNDYNEYRDLIDQFQPALLQKEFMVRKRMRLDKGFAIALLSFDAEGVRGYLMEPILLIKKEKYAGI